MCFTALCLQPGISWSSAQGTNCVIHGSWKTHSSCHSTKKQNIWLSLQFKSKFLEKEIWSDKLSSLSHSALRGYPTVHMWLIRVFDLYPITSWQIDGETVADFIFLGSKITADSDCSHEIKRCLLLGRKVTTNLDSILKSRDYFVDKGPACQSYGFPSRHVWMWELDYKESWAPKNWCFWTVVLEETLESPLDCKEIQPVHPKGNQSWVFIGSTDVEAEIPILWPPVAKNWLIWKDPDAGKDWGQEEKGTIEDEMVGWHHWLNGHGFGWTLGVGDGQGGLVCCGSWGHKESDTTERLNWTEHQ